MRYDCPPKMSIVGWSPPVLRSPRKAGCRGCGPLLSHNALRLTFSGNMELFTLIRSGMSRKGERGDQRSPGRYSGQQCPRWNVRLTSEYMNE
jgi:hypothetical protein